MKTSLPAMVFTCTLVCTSQLVNASGGCAEEGQRNTALGHAIGVLVFNSIVEEYSESATVEDIAVGLKHASDRTSFPLSSKISIQSDPDSKVSPDNSLSVSEAQRIVANWRPQSDQLSQRFLTEYKKRGVQQKSGLLTNRLPLGINGRDQLSNCTRNFLLSTEGNLEQICYMQLQIDIEAVCDENEKATASIINADAQWTYGEFDPDDVIEGWIEVFELLKEKPLEREPQKNVKDDVEPEIEFLRILEVVIPPELAYGVKGMVGKVDPNETLWFLMAIK